MDNNKCSNCNGEGIVGSGEKPWLKEGHLHTCDVCKGTGKIVEADATGTKPAQESIPADSHESAASTGTHSDQGKISYTVYLANLDVTVPVVSIDPVEEKVVVKVSDIPADKAKVAGLSEQEFATYWYGVNGGGNTIQIVE